MNREIYQQSGALEAILKSLGEPICVIGKDLTIQWVNEEFEKYGGSLDQVFGTHCYKAFYHRKKPCIDCPTIKVFKTGKIVRAIQKGYDNRVYEVTASPIKDSTGKISLIVELTKDITDEKKLKDNLRATNKKLSYRLKELDGLYALSTYAMTPGEEEKFFKYLCKNTVTTFSYLDTACVLSLSHQSDENLKVVAYSATIASDRADLLPAYKKILSGIDAYNSENHSEKSMKKIFSSMTDHGVQFAMHMPIVVKEKLTSLLSLMIFDKTGLPIESKNFLHEVSKQLYFVLQRRYLESKLVQSAKLAAAGELTASIAHEINNPLYGIKNCIEMLIDEFPDIDDEMSQLLQLSLQESHRIISLIHSLLNFCRVTEAKMELIDITDLMSDILLLNQNRLKANTIDVETNFDPIPEIEVSPNLIRQVFLNIVNNAIDAMPKGGRLKISSSKTRNHVKISIEDTGIGIPNSKIDKIFQPFYTTKNNVQGAGLGLSITYGILKRHHGEINVKSTPNKKTVFNIILPIRQK